MKPGKRKKRIFRHARVRAKIKGTKNIPRLCVFRSLNHIYAQAIDDGAGTTIAAVDDLKLKEKSKADRASLVGKALGRILKKKSIEKIVFDRGGFKYHGRVRALAEGLKKSGLKF